MTTSLAIDLGGTKTSWAHITDQGAITNRHKLPAARTLEGSLSQIIEAAKTTTPETPIGIIVPGIYDPQKGTAWAPNLWGWDPVPLRTALQSRLTQPITIGSDRSGYALGEQWQGAARDMTDVLFIAIGTGIGVGIIAGGHLIEGAHGIAGAAGWMTVDRDDRPEYKQCGCWEWNAAGPSVARRLGLERTEQALAQARAGDPLAREAFRETAGYLARGIANLVSIFDPQVIVLGGGLMQASDLLLHPIREHFSQWTQPIAAKLVRIGLSSLGDDAGLLGAARLAFLRTNSKELYVGN